MATHSSLWQMVDITQFRSRISFIPRLFPLRRRKIKTFNGGARGEPGNEASPDCMWYPHRGNWYGQLPICTWYPHREDGCGQLPIPLCSIKCVLEQRQTHCYFLWRLHSTLCANTCNLLAVDLAIHATISCRLCFKNARWLSRSLLTVHNPVCDVTIVSKYWNHNTMDSCIQLFSPQSEKQPLKFTLHWKINSATSSKARNIVVSNSFLHTVKAIH